MVRSDSATNTALPSESVANDTRGVKPEWRQRVWAWGVGAALILLLAAWLRPAFQHQQLNRQLALELEGQGQHHNREESLVAIHRLLQQGADVNVRAANGRTALHGLASGRHPEWVAELLDRGANVNAADTGSFTPLMFVVDPETARLLLDHGATVDAPIPETDTPLHRAVFTSPEITRLLLQHGAKVDAINGMHRTPLQYVLAYMNPDLRTIRLLLNHGADPNVGVHQVDLPVVLAAQQGSESCVEMLLSAGADPNAGHPLWAAAVKNSVPAIESLLRHGAQIDARDGNGRSALSNAVAAGAEAAVRCLAEHGADVNLKDAQGLTPLQLSVPSMGLAAPGSKPVQVQQTRYLRIIAFLKQHGAHL